jgi:hypothetical protein
MKHQANHHDGDIVSVIVVPPAAYLDWERVLHGVHLPSWAKHHDVSPQALSTAIPERDVSGR